MDDHQFKMDACLELRFLHRLRFTRGVFNPLNPVLREVLEPNDGRRARVLVFLDESLLQGHPALRQSIEGYFAAHDASTFLAAPIQTVVGGERCKNEPAEHQRMLAAIHDAGMCRHSYVLVIGGGAVLDAVGFAAAIAHRGIRLVRLPTTTLSQGDSGVGVKNGINAFGKKNYLGVFTPPWAVINDEDFLATLSDRDWRGGFAEAVKVALIKDAPLFHRIVRSAARISRRDRNAAMPVLRRSAELHLRHIAYGGDPFEITTARPLDFGHWAAHKLEQMTSFRLRHGEAVAIGLALDTVYSALTRSLSWGEAETILGCLTDLGFVLQDEALADTARLLRGLEEFREHLGGDLTITLLDGIGKPVDVHEIEPEKVAETIDYLLDRERGGAWLQPRSAAVL